MKIRNGFVSNSSSSSYMIAIGVVKNWKKLNTWMEGLKSSSNSSWSYDRDFIFVNPTTDKKKKWPSLIYGPGEYRCQAPTNISTFVRINKVKYMKVESDMPSSIKAKRLLMEQDAEDIIVYCVSNNEGDSSFCNNETGDLNYDIDLDYFDKERVEIYKAFDKKNGIVLVDKIYGAGRNG